MERVLRLTAAADPTAAASVCWARPSHRATSGSSPSPATGAWPAPTTPACCGPRSAWSAEHRANGAEVTVWSVGKKAPPYFRYRGIDMAQSFAGFADRPEFADARHIAAVVAAPFVAGEIDLVADGLDPVHLGRDPAGGAAAAAAAPPARGTTRRSRTWTRGSSRATPSSSLSPRSCWSSWRPGRSRPRSSPRCWRARRRSSPHSSGPWRRPPTTRTSSSAP